MKRFFGFLMIFVMLMVLCTGCSNSGDTAQGETDKIVEADENNEADETEESTEATVSYDADSEDGPWLPDVNTTFGVDGEYYGDDTATNGVTFEYYYYDFEGDSETVTDGIVSYTEALKKLDFEAKKLQDDTAVWYESYTKDGYTAELLLYVADDAEEIADGDSGEWRAVLAVQKGMSFELGSGASGVRDGKTVCVACNGSGMCKQCGGSGTIYYSTGQKTCPVCEGNGVCTVCDGEGSY